MKTATLSAANRQAVKQRALDAFSCKRRGAHISFASANPCFAKRPVEPSGT
jgi:hypothetical protein